MWPKIKNVNDILDEICGIMMKNYSFNNAFVELLLPSQDKQLYTKWLCHRMICISKTNTKFQMSKILYMET